MPQDRNEAYLEKQAERIAERVVRRIEDRFVYAFRSSLYFLLSIITAAIFLMYYFWQLSAAYATLAALSSYELRAASSSRLLIEELRSVNDK